MQSADLYATRSGAVSGRYPPIGTYERTTRPGERTDRIAKHLNGGGMVPAILEPEISAGGVMLPSGAGPPADGPKV